LFSIEQPKLKGEKVELESSIFIIVASTGFEMKICNHRQQYISVKVKIVIEILFFNVGTPKESIFLTTFFGLYFSHQTHILQITIHFSLIDHLWAAFLVLIGILKELKMRSKKVETNKWQNIMYLAH
jgi:threonine/homoserine/homoserine lactone efflux protein